MQVFLTKTVTIYEFDFTLFALLLNFITQDGKDLAAEVNVDNFSTFTNDTSAWDWSLLHSSPALATFSPRSFSPRTPKSTLASSWTADWKSLKNLWRSPEVKDDVDAKANLVTKLKVKINKVFILSYWKKDKIAKMTKESNGATNLNFVKCSWFAKMTKETNGATNLNFVKYSWFIWSLCFEYT